MSAIEPAPMTSPTTRPTLTPLLLILLALLSSFTPLSIDMYLPALPVIAVDLRGTAGHIQLRMRARADLLWPGRRPLRPPGGDPGRAVRVRAGEHRLRPLGRSGTSRAAAL